MHTGKEGLTDASFRIINAIVLGLLGATMLVPLFKVASTSLSSGIAVDGGRVFLWPVEFTLASWERIVVRADLWQSFFLTLGVTVVGTAFCLLMTALMAYPLSRSEFAPAKILIVMVVITMVFRYPIIPYFLTVRNLGLYNNILVLIIPHAIAAYNLIIMRTFFRQFPKELEEAAQMEGCGYFRLLFNIMLPLSKAVLATLGIFYAVGLWNQFMNPLLFIENESLYPLQIRLRQFITGDDLIGGTQTQHESLSYNSATLKAACTIFAIMPILLVYPMLQKHFVKGALLGSVK